MNAVAVHLNGLDLGSIRQGRAYDRQGHPVVSAATVVIGEVVGAVGGVATAVAGAVAASANDDACFDAADGGAGVCG
ncbi:hypothetical protein OK074_6378 [Actinobacteria bacterium OK074]|nr:hypothetical protein OK074_6378 [Actinobacteria bacterium OK074]